MRNAKTLMAMATIMLAVALVLTGCGRSSTPAPPVEDPGTPQDVSHEEPADHGDSPHGTAAPAQVATPAGGPQTTCPIMGGAINKSLFVDHDGKRIYVCCESCLGKIKQDPEKYISKLTGQGIVLEDAPIE